MKRWNGEKGSASGNFMSGVLVLSLSTLIVKIIGLAYKIPMIAYLGAEGMGYFNSAYEIYAMLCVISTAGLPVALSMLISANKEKGAFGSIRQIDRSAMTIFLLLGSIGATLMLCFADPISSFIGNKGAVQCIFAIAPALLCVCFSSAVRGYYQGFHRMAPTAISQLIEAVGKLVFGVWFASIGLKKGLDIPTVAAMAVLGLSLGTLLSAVYLLALRIADGKKKHAVASAIHAPPVLRHESEHHARTLLRIAIPITLSSAVLSMTRLADMALIMRRLQTIGVGAAEANRIYGSYTTLAVPVFSLIPSLITPISLTLVPQLSGAIEKRCADGQAEVSDRAIRLTVLLAMPASMGITVYAKPILSLLFSGETEAIEISYPLLSLLGISILFAGLITTTNAILQSYRQTVKPILSMAIGAAVKMITAYVLIGIPSVGVYGAPISTFCCNVTITAINFYFLAHCIPDSRKANGFFHVYCKPLAASLAAIMASLAVYIPIGRLLDNDLPAFCISFCVAGLVYVLLVFLLKIITKDDLALLPMGNKLIDFLQGKKQKIPRSHIDGSS